MGPALTLNDSWLFNSVLYTRLLLVSLEEPSIPCFICLYIYMSSKTSLSRHSHWPVIARSQRPHCFMTYYALKMVSFASLPSPHPLCLSIQHGGKCSLTAPAERTKAPDGGSRRGTRRTARVPRAGADGRFFARFLSFEDLDGFGMIWCATFKWAGGTSMR